RELLLFQPAHHGSLFVVTGRRRAAKALVASMETEFGTSQWWPQMALTGNCAADVHCAGDFPDAIWRDVPAARAMAKADYRGLRLVCAIPYLQQLWFVRGDDHFAAGDNHRGER